MARFDTRSIGSNDPLLERKYNDTITLLNRFAGEAVLSANAVMRADILFDVAFKDAAQTFATATTATKIAFDNRTRSVIALSSNGFLVPTGNWLALIALHVRFAANTTGVRYQRITVDSTNICIQKGNAASTGINEQTVTGMAYVTGANVIYGYAYQNSGGNLDMTAGTLGTGSTLAVTLIPLP